MALFADLELLELIRGCSHDNNDDALSKSNSWILDLELDCEYSLYNVWDRLPK